MKCLPDRVAVVSAARAGVAQAAADVMDNGRGILSPAVQALDGPAVDTATAPQIMPMSPMMGPVMAPMMAPMTAPMAAMAPAVQVGLQSDLK